METTPLGRVPVHALDHVVVLVRELAASAHTWARMGFTLSPRGEHSAIVGTANHTIMFERDYLELLVTQGDTAVNQEWRALMAAGGEGLYGTVLATADVDAVQRRLTSHGVTISAPLAFERPVEMPDQPAMRARFRVSWAAPGTVPGLKLFVCEHLDRQAVWLPELQRHPNSALGIHGLHLQVPDLRQAVQHWSRVLGADLPAGQAPAPWPPGLTAGDAGAWSLRVGPHHLWLQERMGAPARVRALYLRVANLDRCRACLREGAFSLDESLGMIRVPDINGVNLVFTS